MAAMSAREMEIPVAQTATDSQMTDAVIGGLTIEQRHAAGARLQRLCISAGPGAGKTLVSAHRFGVERFAREHLDDDRAVVAVSFTRAATFSLVRRIQRVWGSHAVRWPHRVATLDTVMIALLQDLLRAGLVQWPGGALELQVEDSWAPYGVRVRSYNKYRLTLNGSMVEPILVTLAEALYMVNPSLSVRLINRGVCTHDDVRAVLSLALKRLEVQHFIRERFSHRFRALIVDEVYDANELDIAVIELAVDAGVSVTLVGDQWQALYFFRGARPEAIPELVTRRDFDILELTHSFRWQTRCQAQLADQIRSSIGVQIPAVTGEDILSLDVVLSLTWASLWELGPQVLPIGFRSFKGGAEEAAAILVLNHVTRSLFGVDATYFREALISLAIFDEAFQVRALPQLEEIVNILRRGGKAGVNAAYEKLSALVAENSPRQLRPTRANHTNRLKDIQSRIVQSARPVPGLTVHQAKGGEWDRVGLCLDEKSRATLGSGLRIHEEMDRALYVACTRARRLTVEVTVAVG